MQTKYDDDNNGLGGSATFKITPTFLTGDLTRKLGQTDLVFVVLSQFISTSVHARLQVSVCSSYDLCHPDNDRQTDSILTSLYEELSQLS